jgi:hypothetical protein
MAAGDEYRTKAAQFEAMAAAAMGSQGGAGVGMGFLRRHNALALIFVPRQKGPLANQKRSVRSEEGRKGSMYPPLARLLARPRDGIEYVEHLEGDGGRIFEHACKLGLEGIVSKRIDMPYRPGSIQELAP